ncbi:TetR/AcrR family transcriptional regulator [Rothia uropygialis]|uniref:TetR/AcrR family transcriptional regulator n=1 Tax=Kocuria sp. 36 TaxID=1415402 RepID=UPI00101D7134|nr:TetR/AcrR family transcriptional regulator [Kocuria sp. 36]
MPRKRRMEHEQARELILGTALTTFAHNGFYSTTMDEIGEISNLSKPFLYRYFKSKDDLYLAVVDDCVEKFLSMIHTPLHAELSSEERTESSIQVLTDFVIREPDRYKILFESDMLNTSAVDERVSRLREGLVDTLTQVLLKESKFTEEAACRLCAEAIISAALTSSKVIAAAETPEEQNELSKVLIRFAWGGIHHMDD